MAAAAAAAAGPQEAGKQPVLYPDGQMTLGYWKIRGLAQAIRVLCEYCYLSFENKMFAQAPCPRPIPELMCKRHPFPSWEACEESKACWFDVKETAIGDYHSPNLPYLLDGDVKLSESNAILRYVGKKAVAKGGACATICGGTPSEAAANEVMIDKAMELRNKVIGIGYGTCGPSFTGAMDQLVGQNAAAYWEEQATACKGGEHDCRLRHVREVHG